MGLCNSIHLLHGVVSESGVTPCTETDESWLFTDFADI